MSCETWKDIAGYDGRYQVSNKGHVRSISHGDTKILRETANRGGYLKVTLCRKGQRKTAYIHRLVGKAFLDNCNNYPMLNHIDGNKQNNDTTNLEWCTASHNMAHAYRLNPQPFLAGFIYHAKFVSGKPVVQIDRQGNVIRCFENAETASAATGICARTILQVAHGEKWRKTAGGFQWRFKDA